MEENRYQKLGPRAFLFDFFSRCKIAFILLILTLVLAIGKMIYGIPSSVSSFASILGTLIFWGSLATLAAFAITSLVSWLEYLMFQFSLDADIFKIKRGVFTKVEIAIPYRRIESVDIKRTIVHQLFGVSRINIETTIDSEATADNKSDASDEVFPVIDHVLARTIQEELTKRANVQKMRA